MRETKGGCSCTCRRDWRTERCRQMLAWCQLTHCTVQYGVRYAGARLSIGSILPTCLSNHRLISSRYWKLLYSKRLQALSVLKNRPVLYLINERTHNNATLQALQTRSSHQYGRLSNLHCPHGRKHGQIPPDITNSSGR